MLPYSLDVYFSVVGRMNTEIWWAAMLAVLTATLVVLSVWEERRRLIARLAALLIAAGWLVTGQVFYGTHLEPLFFGANWFRWAWLAQGGLMILAAIALPRALPQGPRPAVWCGTALMLAALVVLPTAETLLRDGWPAIRLVGLAPEPTVMFTCGWLLTRRPGWPVTALALVPLAGATAAGYSALALGWPLDWIVPAAALLLLLLPCLVARNPKPMSGTQ